MRFIPNPARVVKHVSRLLSLCTYAMLLGAAVSPAQDMKTSEAPPKIPFSEWVVETKRTDLPWSIHISAPKLSILQRLVVEIRVEVPGSTLHLLGPTYQLFLEARLKEEGAGEWLEADDVVGTRLLERMPKQNHLEFSLQALVRPGKYTVGLILFDRFSGKRSAGTRKLTVRPIGGDPLPESFRDLPKVEFFQSGVDENREALPEIKSRLWLPVKTRRPVQIELLVNFAAPEPTAGPLGMSGIPASAQRNAKSLLARHQRTIGQMLGVVKVFSQMEIPKGSLHITAIDVLHREVFFEQDAAGELDWPRLSTALQQLNPLRMPVSALAGRYQNAAFFREVLQRRFAQAEADPPAQAGSGGDGGGEPVRVFIIVSAPVVFERGSDLSPVARPRDADYRVYYLESRFGSAYVWDDLPRVLHDLAPRRFDLQTAEDFRRALARVLADLREM